MPKPKRTPTPKTLPAEERSIKATSLRALRHFRKLEKWYGEEASKREITDALATHGQITETSVFILKRLNITPEKRSEAIKLLTEDGHNMLLLLKVGQGEFYPKKDFIVRIDHALKVLPKIQAEVLREIPHGRQIIEGLPGVREKLLADPRTMSKGGAGIMSDITKINIIELRRILGTKEFEKFSKIQTQLMNEVIKQHTS